MSGWDRDTGGDYVPPDPPLWFWIAAAVFVIAPVVAWLFFG